MLAFYLDHNVHGAITRGLRRREIDVLTALEDGRHDEHDPLLLARATDLHRVFVTHDEDFHALAAHCRQGGVDFSGVVFVMQEGMRIGPVVEYLLMIADAMSAEEICNRVEYVPRRG